jgi:hypothetical protein
MHPAVELDCLERLINVVINCPFFIQFTSWMPQAETGDSETIETNVSLLINCIYYWIMFLLLTQLITATM